MQHFNKRIDEPTDKNTVAGITVAGGDPVNDVRWFDEESEARNDIFGRGQNNQGCAPVPTFNRLSSTGIFSPITGAAMPTAGSFGEICRR
jgi:hypothetical protein